MSKAQRNRGPRRAVFARWGGESKNLHLFFVLGEVRLYKTRKSLLRRGRGFQPPHKGSRINAGFSPGGMFSRCPYIPGCAAAGRHVPDDSGLRLSSNSSAHPGRCPPRSRVHGWPTSNRARARIALRQRSRAGRFVVAPDKPWSLKNVLHPARFKPASCKAVLWSSVDTRA
jgi:hypothetical protein